MIRGIRFFLYSIFCLSLLLPSGFVMADGPDNPHVPEWASGPPAFAKAYLMDNTTGKKEDIQVTIFQDVDSIKYEFTILGFSSYLSRSKWDSGGGLRGTITMYYNTKTIGIYTYHAVDRYNAKWEKFDNAYTLKDAFIQMGVAGVSESGQYISDVQNATVGVPVSGTTYVSTTWWMPQYFKTGDAIFS